MRTAMPLLARRATFSGAVEVKPLLVRGCLLLEVPSLPPSSIKPISAPNKTVTEMVGVNQSVMVFVFVILDFLELIVKLP